MNPVEDLAVGFIINFAVAFIIVRFIYYPEEHNKNYVFTFMAYNTIIFFLLSVLGKSAMTLGVGFGLFALFSMLRYRTDPIPSREMTYLFALIALPAINSIFLGQESLVLMLMVNSLITIVLFFLEKGWGFHYELSRKIVYDNIELLRPEYEIFLIADLQQRTGMPIKRVEIGNMNLAAGSANLQIYFDDPKTEKENIRYFPPSQLHAITMEKFASSHN